MTAKQSDNDVNSREHWKRAVSNPKEFGLSDRQVQAMSDSLTLTDPDYWKKVMADPEAYGLNASQATQLAKWGTKTRHERDHEQTQLTPAKKMEMEDGFHRGFYGDKHVQTWLKMGAVSPQEAALLFFNQNPFKYKDGLPFMGVEFGSMKRSFEDAALDGLTRNLKDWIAVARDRNLHGVGIEGWWACITVYEQKLENKYRRSLASEIVETESEIAKCEKMSDGGKRSEAMAIKNQLDYLRDRLGKLETLFNHPAALLKDCEALTDADLDKAVLAAGQPDNQTQTPSGIKASESDGVAPAKAETSTKVNNRRNRRTWRDVAFPYMVETLKAGQYVSTKAFFKALESKAGRDDSPFDKGSVQNSRSLFVRAISKPLALKTLENVMPELRKAAYKS